METYHFATGATGGEVEVVGAGGTTMGEGVKQWRDESTSALWVILVINVNISLVGLILLPSIFQISSTMEWHGLEDVEPLQNSKDKELAQAQSSGLYIFSF